MKWYQRFSLRTWLIIIAAVLLLLAMLILAWPADAASPGPGSHAMHSIAWEKPDWVVLRQIKYAEWRAKRAGCILAQADYSNAYLKFYKRQRADAYTWLRLGDRHFARCTRRR